ncbi:NEDD8-activating enzyme E1 regulatory subunit-like isoform X2 [Saccostrea echinata]|uniref:NEDD8-activating enzyme E1 regulatory subunit-like isoform X2 n=1 Tax=Saccostrea echinata TaxID=191078 RepID=UPI002A8066E5|nr:NEDD8-activating enzyme E1 regulatory subunit-like isoform X2 [Saccostrea echinata]
MAGKGKGGLDKNNKYDRQIRLWGDHGQTALEQTRVCLINATATGTETLKNLILPGVGSFTIVDGNKVKGEDVGNNFFLSQESIGKSRAKIATELLNELNDDVSGNYEDEFPESLLQNNPDFFKRFTIVIATGLSERILLQLADVLWKQSVPLLVCRSYGFIGYMRLVVREHTVIESHPDNAHEDLRLDRPFPSLVKYCDSLHLDTMDKKDHSHTPWLVIIYKYLQEWKKQHDGLPPQNYKEKNQLKQMIREGIRKNEEGVPEVEENFDEAIKSVNLALVPTKIPTEVEQLFNDPSAMNLTSESKPFWILLRAVKEFVENEGKGALPLRGSIPDMTADSERYIQLQNAYIEQANKDVAVITDKVNMLTSTLAKGVSISDQEIKLFCKNAAFVRVLRCRSLAEEYESQAVNTQDIGSHLEDEDGESELIFYPILRGVNRFYEEYNRYPGEDNDQVEPDVQLLKGIIIKLIHEWGLTSSVKEDYIHEICRYGASELHTVASVIGGCAAQEVIKIITGQFIPLDNTFIYNAVKQTSISVTL